MVSKYTPLTKYLEAQSADSVVLDFEQIEGIIGAPLPLSASKHRAWWANEVFGSHPWATEWMEAGWLMDHVSLADGKAWFKQGPT